MKYKLQYLIGMEHIKTPHNRLNEIYSFPTAIIDNDGNFLTATTWQDFCLKVHNIKDYECNCIQRDQNIISHLNISAVIFIRRDNAGVA